jgi:hypothetical protein
LNQLEDNCTLKYVICVCVRESARARKNDCNSTIINFRTLLIFIIFSASLGPWVYSASNRNEYWKQKNNGSGK